MGTRSNTIIISDGKILVNIYRQFDGYPAGHGVELAAFLAPITMVNGLSDTSKPIANGMGCLAAQLIAKLKTGPGGIYIHSPHDCGNYYTYTIKGKTMAPENGLQIEVKEYKKVIFTGNPHEFSKFCEQVTA